MGPALGRQRAFAESEVVEEVIGAADHDGTVADQLERRLGERAGDRTGHREDLDAEIHGVLGRDPGAAPSGALDHHHASRERGDQSVPRREPVRFGGHAGRVLAQEGADALDLSEELPAPDG